MACFRRQRTPPRPIPWSLVGLASLVSLALTLSVLLGVTWGKLDPTHWPVQALPRSIDGLSRRSCLTNKTGAE